MVEMRLGPFDSNAYVLVRSIHAELALRVDAVASMIYLDYSRKKVNGNPNIMGI